MYRTCKCITDIRKVERGKPQVFHDNLQTIKYDIYIYIYIYISEFVNCHYLDAIWKSKTGVLLRKLEYTSDKFLVNSKLFINEKYSHES